MGLAAESVLGPQKKLAVELAAAGLRLYVAEALTPTCSMCSLGCVGA
jgi:hypothetical protein